MTEGLKNIVSIEIMSNYYKIIFQYTYIIMQNLFWGRSNCSKICLKNKVLLVSVHNQYSELFLQQQKFNNLNEYFYITAVILYIISRYNIFIGIM